MNLKHKNKNKNKIKIDPIRSGLHVRKVKAMKKRNKNKSAYVLIKVRH